MIARDALAQDVVKTDISVETPMPSHESSKSGALPSFFDGMVIFFFFWEGSLAITETLFVLFFQRRDTITSSDDRNDSVQPLLRKRHRDGAAP